MATKNNTDETVEETENDAPQQQEPTPPAAPPADPNPYLPVVEEETYRNFTITSDAFPMKRIMLRYPNRHEEVKVRANVRRLAYQDEVSPEELDTWSQNNYYVASLLKFCCDNDEPVDWMAIVPQGRRQSEALDEAVIMIINWRFLYDTSSSK